MKSEHCLFVIYLEWWGVYFRYFISGSIDNLFIKFVYKYSMDIKCMSVCMYNRSLFHATGNKT